jgi:hypothetical protein
MSDFEKGLLAGALMVLMIELFIFLVLALRVHAGDFNDKPDRNKGSED